MIALIKNTSILLIGLLLHTSVHAVDKIRISIPNLSGQFMTMSLAQKRGFLREEGIDAEILRITGGAASAAMSGGDLDYSTGMGLGSTITGAYAVKAVACFVPTPVFSLVARPEIKSVAELKGKTVGVSTFSGVSIFGTRVIAKHYGLDPDRDLKYVAVGAVEGRFIRLMQGLLDATILAPPLDTEAKKKGFNILVKGEDILVFPETGLVTAAKKIQSKPDEVKRVIRAGIKANRYIRGNRDGTIQFIMDWLNVNKEVAATTYDGVANVYNEDPAICEKGLRVIIDERKQAMKITREVSLGEVADLSLIREALKEMGNR